MICHVCGSAMEPVKTGLPFKMRNDMLVVIKNLPVFQCECCSACLLDDTVLKQVDKILDNVDTDAELEVIRYHE